MIIPRHAARVIDLVSCHGGAGTLCCTEYLGDYDRASAGFAFIHDNILPPGAGVGLHTHTGDEEIYFFLEGCGTMTVNGTTVDVGPGDCCLTRSGESHSLLNTGGTPIHFLVVGTNLGPKESRQAGLSHPAERG